MRAAPSLSRLLLLSPWHTSLHDAIKDSDPNGRRYVSSRQRPGLYGLDIWDSAFVRLRVFQKNISPFCVHVSHGRHGMKQLCPKNVGLGALGAEACIKENIEHSTSNVQRSESIPMKEKNYDLEERLLEYAARIIHLVEKLPNTRIGNQHRRTVIALRHFSLPLECSMLNVGRSIFNYPVLPLEFVTNSAIVTVHESVVKR